MREGMAPIMLSRMRATSCATFMETICRIRLKSAPHAASMFCSRILFSRMNLTTDSTVSNVSPRNREATYSWAHPRFAQTVANAAHQSSTLYIALHALDAVSMIVSSVHDSFLFSVARFCKNGRITLATARSRRSAGILSAKFATSRKSASK